ncbi:oligosaccharide flippase family protein, partial [Vibrio vulnificus]|nr:oligosaccharide flippase family protein [Vibrio vulnificus]
MKAVTEAKVIKNAWWIIISKVFQSLLQLVVLILVARHLGPAEFGIINYAISIVVFLTPLAFIGLNNILVHEIIKNPQIEGLIIGTSISLSVFSSLLCAGLVIFFVQHTNSGEVKLQIVCVLYSLILIFQSLELIKYWFQAKLLAKYASIISLFVYAIITIYNL